MKKLKYIFGILALVVLIGFDQWTKYLAAHFLKGKEAIPLIPDVFELQYLENQGAAFGMFQNKIIFFVILTVVILLGIGFLYYKLPPTRHYFALHSLAVVLAAGAIGNMIDRIQYHYVIDFLYFKCIQFPVFNVADCYVTISMILLCILVLFYYKDEDLKAIGLW